MTEKTVDEYFEERGWDITEFYQSLYDRERLADSMSVTMLWRAVGTPASL